VFFAKKAEAAAYDLRSKVGLGLIVLGFGLADNVCLMAFVRLAAHVPRIALAVLRVNEMAGNADRPLVAHFEAGRARAKGFILKGQGASGGRLFYVLVRTRATGRVCRMRLRACRGQRRVVLPYEFDGGWRYNPSAGA